MNPNKSEQWFGVLWYSLKMNIIQEVSPHIPSALATPLLLPLLSPYSPLMLLSFPLFTADQSCGRYSAWRLACLLTFPSLVTKAIHYRRGKPCLVALCLVQALS